MRLLCTLCVVLSFSAIARGQNAPVPPDKAVAAIALPEGFRARLVAAEPRLVKPIAMTTDERGRLWVVESHCYPHWIQDGKEGTDRILIFEDKQGKGQFDCTVFWDKGTNLSGIAVGFGGVWLCASPNLVFVPFNPGEDKPSGPPQIVLDGWDVKAAKHNVFNSLVWGPDGWLYGCNGIQSQSRVGKPGTPKEERVAINCGVWRHHPTKHLTEAVAHGSTNPWGLDFDDHGEMFITNCVIKHVFHVVPGAHFQRMYGEDINPHSYGLIESCADHLHWAGGSWTSSRGGQGAHGESGGGHAHAGAMVYLGDSWPDVYRNRLLMANLHGNRLNQDILDKRGSGYVVRHGQDFMTVKDPWFRGLSLMAGVDGMFVADWCDTGECHNYDKVAPFGRVYKITYGDPKHAALDLAKSSDDELVQLQLHKNDWLVRQARRLLQERAHAGKLGEKIRPRLLQMLGEQKEATRQLRILWALYVTGGLDDKTFLALLDNSDASIRGWAVRLLVEDRKVSDAVAAKFADMARAEQSPAVRLSLASALQRLPLTTRWPIAEGLTSHAGDWNDLYLPLMNWYGVEALVSADPARAVDLLTKAKLPLVRQYIARRIASSAERGLPPLMKTLADAENADLALDVLRGLQEAYRGRSQATAPEGWAAASKKLLASANVEVRQRARMQAVLYGDKEALASLRQVAADGKAGADERRDALRSLIEVKASDLLPLLRDLLADATMRGPALRGLATMNDAGTPAAILKHYGTFSDAEKADAINTLATRADYALALLDAVEKEQVPRRDISVYTARQILNLKDKRLPERLAAVWGTIRPANQDKLALMAKYKSLVPADALLKADRSRGRALFAKSCANCHVLFGDGGKVGPDLTGSQRANPEYLFTKLLDPSAVVPKDYQMSIIETVNGRVIQGIVSKEEDKTITVLTPTEVLTLQKKDIQERQKTTQSIMPEGQLATLSDAEVRDLIAYLAGKEQVALPKSP